MTWLLGAQLVALVFFALPPGRLDALRAISIDQWRAIDRETVRVPAEAGATSKLVLLLLVAAAVSLTLQQYFGDSRVYMQLFPPDADDGYYELTGFAWWSLWRCGGYILVPLVVLVATRSRIRDFHLSPRGFFKHLWIYVVLYLCVLPFVIGVSDTQAFRDTYPFYRMANRSQFDLWSWELLYAAQFVALEVFFRGVMLHGLRRALGANAIFVMIVPYCMIHFGKPLPETLGAIVAGLVLGTLAMRTRSIWGGVLIHVGVAMTMDVLALRACPPIGSGESCPMPPL
jgi:membrane protease YdiL (CAAX protease family)